LSWGSTTVATNKKADAPRYEKTTQKHPHFALKRTLMSLRESFLNVLQAEHEFAAASLIWVNDGYSAHGAPLTCPCRFPPDEVRVRPSEGRTNEANQVYGRADYRHEAGAKAADLARKHGVSEATLYNWKAKFGGMDVSEAKRLRQLEDENAKLKKLLAEQVLDVAALRELLSKNGRARGWAPKVG
jgi:putative transposase